MTLAGGPVSILLGFMAVAAVVIFLERFLELRRAQVDWQYFVDGVLNVLERGNVDEALANCDDTAVPVANVVATAIRHRDASARVLKESVDAQGRAEVGRLRSSGRYRPCSGSSGRSSASSGRSCSSARSRSSRAPT